MKHQFDTAIKIESKLKQLMDMYMEGIRNYFSLPNTLTKMEEVFNCLEYKKVRPDEEPFKKWVLEKAKDFAEMITNKQYSNDESAIAQIEYQIYLLEDELDMQYPESLISSLIEITEQLPKHLNEIEHTFFDVVLNNYSEKLVDFNLEESQETILKYLSAVSQSASIRLDPISPNLSDVRGLIRSGHPIQDTRVGKVNFDFVENVYPTIYSSPSTFDDCWSDNVNGVHSQYALAYVK